MTASTERIPNAAFDFSWKLGLVAMSPARRKELQEAADTYARAEGARGELAGHVGACTKTRGFWPYPSTSPCGTGWHCDDAIALGATGETT